jgi:putative flavoprotein involved in K+ transport
MLEKIKTSAEDEVRSWISAFGAALARADASALGRMFQSDSHWRNLCGISWQIATFSGSRKLADELCRRAREVGATGFEIDSQLLLHSGLIEAGRLRYLRRTLARQL